MKKIFSYLAATAMLFAASCSNEDLGTNNANDTQVTFNLSLEGQSGTRAIGDGTSVTDLHYAVFDADGNRLTQIAKVRRTDEFTATDNTANVKLTLAKDQTYTVVFWAQHKEADYTINDNMVVTVSYAANSNNEKRDAFFKAETFTVTGSESINVVLTRPFAQLNVGVTKADYDAAVASGVTITQSKAVVTGVYNTLNLLDGTVSNVNFNGVATFAKAATPKAASETLKVKVNGVETFYEYLSMNYILVGKETSQNVAAEFEFYSDNGKKIDFKSGLDVIPVQRNFRTNLVGQILTGNLDFNVTIDDDFKGDVNYSGIVYANNQEEVNSALKDANAHTIILGDDTFNLDLYNIDEKNTLNIVGTTGTKVEFANLQVRMSQFKNFRIVNCEILRMPGKSWGMMVFGSGDKSDGVYTISNCTFNGVGTQGIYINETVSGATYNIEDCTFNGDFGGEGAITIQTNKDVEHNVNVKGCTFNNIPTTSHKIFLAKNPEVYYDFNLDTDLQATTAYEIDMFAKLGQPVELPTGNYNIANVLVGNNMTIKGTEDVVITVDKPNLNGGNLTLEGVTVKGLGTYTGVQHANTVTYNNAKIVGEMCLYGEKVVFNKCTFELSNGQYIWTYGAKVVEFNECTFNTSGKAILVYNEGAGASNVTVKDCKFYATAGDKAGAIANQNCAAIEIDNFGGKVGNENLPGMAHKVTISGNNQYDDGEKFSGLWRIKNFVAGNPVTVNDVQYTQIAIDGKLMTIDANKNVTVQ